jgi:hypothetical protein
MAKKAKVAISLPDEPATYAVELETNGQICAYEVESIEEALGRFTRGMVKSKAILTVRKGKRQATLPLQAFQLRRIVTSAYVRRFTAKRLDLLLK